MNYSQERHMEWIENPFCVDYMVEDKENIDIRRPEEKSNQEIFRRYVQMEICVSNFEKACGWSSIRLFRKQSAKNDEEYWSEQEGQGLFLQHDDVFVQLCHFVHLCVGTNVYELYQERRKMMRDCEIHPPICLYVFNFS